MDEAPLDQSDVRVSRCLNPHHSAPLSVLGSINKKKEQKKKKGLTYEALRLPAITAFSSGEADSTPSGSSP